MNIIENDNIIFGVNKLTGLSDKEITKSDRDLN